MKTKCSEPVAKHAVVTVLIISGVIGFCLGELRATFQDSVETGQVMAGIVEYPPDNPLYLYHLKVFSLINQFSALLLVLTGSEKAASIIVSGLLGMISFQAVSTFIFMINRNVSISVLGGVFVYFTHYVGCGKVYPIHLLGISSTYGILGLSFIVLVIALIGAGAHRLGMFCLGLAPAIHPSYGSWLYVVVVLTALFEWDHAKKMVASHYKWLVAGFAIALLGLSHQLVLMQGLPDLDPDLKKRYLINFIRQWDYHRQKFYWDNAAQQFRFFHDGVVFCLFSIVAGLLCLVQFRETASIRFVARLIVLSGVGSLAVAAITHLPPERVPITVLMFMPGRYINLNNLALVASILGLLTCCGVKHRRLNPHLYMALFIGASRHGVDWRMVTLALILLWLAYAVGSNYISNKKKSPGATPSMLPGAHAKAAHAPGSAPFEPGFTIGWHRSVLLFFLAIYLSIYLQDANYRHRFLFFPEQYQGFFFDRFFDRVSERPGMIATTTGFSQIPLFTRRPVLVNTGSAFDGFSMAPESGEVLNAILKRVYGVDLLAPPPQRTLFGGKLHPGLYRGLWEERSVEEWQDIRKTFGVTDVLTESDWKLSLPVVFGDAERTLYTIPDPAG